MARKKSDLLNYFFLHMDTNQEELQIKVVFSRLCQSALKLYFKDLLLLLLSLLLAVVVLVLFFI